ncbi:MAG: SdiA-regulated domain-containing protein [Hymenobacteraceae bacterium]|nr:SdiA-regulated domain-containing protein [Hymenobacteraceae bacterium]MDX5398086.1 SdiA-regulated domain-containing protein [Hymenobacteraceae bacterium]MDX5514158.1 SdiA-regulated domain-containing protein [Hymenobacteraceae bacterium]
MKHLSKLIVSAGVCLCLSGAITGQHQKNTHLTEVTAQANLSGYTLSKPDARYLLPGELREISGLTLVSDNSFACVQDEKGTIFIYDFRQNKITNRYNFHDDGDYEGLVQVGQTMYVLRSDGRIIKVENYASKEPQVTVLQTKVPAQESEGINYDARQQRLLIATKSQPNHADKDERGIFAFDLKAQTLAQQPVLKFNQEKLLDKFKDRKKPEFQPSGLAVHPLTQHLYVLSANDPFIAVFDKNGKVLQVLPLNKKLFNQPEGITFNANGDMFISNESGGGPATVLRFNYKSS